jgi:flagellar biosynthesis/type III secretory pathway protein FliH
MMELPKPMDELLRDEIREFEKERFMPYVTSVERIGREEGLKDGLQQGLKDGLQQGLKDGLQQGLLEGIEVALKLRFGDDGLLLLPEIRQIADVELLRKIHRAIVAAANPDDIRKVWAGESR